MSNLQTVVTDAPLHGFCSAWQCLAVYRRANRIKHTRKSLILSFWAHYSIALAMLETYEAVIFCGLRLKDSSNSKICLDTCKLYIFCLRRNGTSQRSQDKLLWPDGKGQGGEAHHHYWRPGMDFDDLVSTNPLVDGNITANSQSDGIFTANRSIGSVEILLDTSLETLFRLVLN